MYIFLSRLSSFDGSKLESLDKTTNNSCNLLNDPRLLVFISHLSNIYITILYFCISVFQFSKLQQKHVLEHQQWVGQVVVIMPAGICVRNAFAELLFWICCGLCRNTKSEFGARWPGFVRRSKMFPQNLQVKWKIQVTSSRSGCVPAGFCVRPGQKCWKWEPRLSICGIETRLRSWTGTPVL